MNLRDSLLAKVANPLTTVEVDGVTVWVRKLTYLARLQLFDVKVGDDSSSAERKKAMEAITKNAILFCVCDEQGNTLFTEADWPALEADPSGTLDKLANAVLSTNGATEKAAQETGKSSEAAHGGNSASAPASPSESSPAK